MVDPLHISAHPQSKSRIFPSNVSPRRSATFDGRRIVGMNEADDMGLIEVLERIIECPAPAFGDPALCPRIPGQRPPDLKSGQTYRFPENQFVR